MTCSSGCRTPGLHATFGECLRAKNVQIDRFALQNSAQGGASPQVMEKRKNQSLERYRQMRLSGLEPQSPLRRDMDACERKVAADG